MGRSTTRNDLNGNLAFWKKRLTDVPDLRWDKVAAVRRALGQGRYTVSSRLDRILPELHNDAGVLCRREADLEEEPASGRDASDVQIE